MHAKYWLAPALSLLAPVGLAQDFTERAKVQGTTTTAGDTFGVDVATDGRRTVVGARHGFGAAPGKAHVFDGCSAIAEVQELVPSDGFVDDDFGYSVAIHGDRIVVGAPQFSTGAGAAYVFHFDGVQWVEEQKITAADGAVGDYFGFAVDIQNDLIAIGAYEHNNGKGAAYLFRFDGTQWGQEAKPVHNATFNDQFGYSVSIDGDVVAVGAINDSPFFSFFTNQGSVQMFQKVGSNWVGGNFLVPVSTMRPFDRLGASVALQGNRVLIGAPGVDDPQGGADRGAVLAYELGLQNWELKQTLIPAGAVAGDNVGWHVSLDGDTAVVSAYLHDSAAPNAGCAFVYHHDGTQWVESQKLTTSDAQADDQLYGVSVRGGMLVAGVYRDDDMGADSGSIYVFADSFRTYRAGLAGAGGMTPTIDAVGNASLGGTITLQVRDFVGGAHCCFLTGIAAADVPFFGGTLLLDITQPYVGTPVALPGSAPGEGDVDVALPVPVNPSFSCVNLYIQAFAFDVAAPVGVSMTNGLHVFIE